jgi:glycosyltransferase involved in cell wall biosynthesis
MAGSCNAQIQQCQNQNHTTAPFLNAMFFSVIIPCYNQSHFLDECLQSVYEQSYKDWEAIIVNDGSTDDTSHIAEQWTQKDQRFRLIEKENGGLSSARNAGVEHASGSYLQFLDADDRLLPGCFEKAAMHISKNGAKVIQTGYRYTDTKGKRIFHTTLPGNKPEFIPGILTGNYGPVHSFIIEKQVAEKAGLFDMQLKSAEDWDFWIRVGKSGTNMIHFIPEPLVDYRITDNSMSRNARTMYQALKTVALRAPQEDDRLPVHNGANKNYSIDPLPGIQKSFLMCLGVHIMQGHTDDAAAWFEEESANMNFHFQTRDFAAMCSYLSFRYRYSKQEIKWVLGDVRENFKSFFKAIHYSGTEMEKALYSVFQQHLMKLNKARFGAFSFVANRLAQIRLNGR